MVRSVQSIRKLDPALSGRCRKGLEAQRPQGKGSRGEHAASISAPCGFQHSMADSLQFETPENVQVRYAPAGVGTRFVAWFVDQFFMWLMTIGILILLACAGVSFEAAFESLDPHRDDPQKVGAYVIGLMMLLLGLGSFVYFMLLELFLRGQTIGKRMMKIRVVKADGFALDAGSIFVRNLFRVVDSIPLLWVVPVLSRLSQRTGDMVAGTIVISDEQPELSDLRTQLASRPAAEAEFRFDSRSLGRLSEGDFEAVERVLERWLDLPEPQQRKLLGQLVPSLARKMQLEEPPFERRLRFLEDLLAAEFRRQNRLLG
jgi:uncharacterized RDD family membrane protein YckC